MDGVIGLVLIVAIVFGTIYGVNQATIKVKNSKLRTLLKVTSCFLVIELFILCWPLAGYGIYSFADYVERISGIIFDPFFLIIEIGFIVAIAYFAKGAYEIVSKEKVQEAIHKKKSEIKQLESKINQRQNIVHLILLLEQCNADVAEIMKRKDIMQVIEIENEINQKKLEIRNLANKVIY